MEIFTYIVMASVMVGCFAQQQSSTVGNITASVLGQSGKIRLYRGDNETDGIVITFSAIKERTETGDEIKAHSYNNFAQLDFTFSDLEDTTYMDSNVSVTKFSFSAEIPVDGANVKANLVSEVFLFTEDGNITVAGDEVNVTEGTMKFNVEINSWTFCDTCKVGNQDLAGALLDFEVDIKGTDPPTMTAEGEYDFGGATVLVPREVIYDNMTTKDMPVGYPKLTVQGAKNIFTFRFERFDDSVFYDPTVDLGSENSTDGTDDTDGTTTESTIVPEVADGSLTSSGLEVKVQGQSGKMTIMKTGETADSGTDSVTVEFDNLMEKDSQGEMINDNAHKVITFAREEFTFSSAMDEDYPGTQLGVKKITFQSELNNQATVKIYIYIFKEAGDIENENETISVKAGDLKFNVEISSWAFCESDSNCPKNAVGEYLDFEIVMKGKSKASKNKDAQNDEYELGNAVVTLSNEIMVDGAAVQMADGYPKMVTKGSKDVFQFRFPKFTSSVMYDPTMSLGGSGSSATRASIMSILVLALCALIKNIL